MNISNNFDEKRLYRGLVVEDGLPLLADNFHESFDIVLEKNNKALESLVGSGILTPIDVTYDSDGIKLNKEIVLNIEGDIVVVQTSDGTPLVPLSDVNPLTIEGTVALVGWYQLLTSQDTMREYGGVRNAVIGNNLIDPTLQIQVSKRVQFRWDIVIVDSWDPDRPTLTYHSRDQHGNPVSGQQPSILSPETKKGGLYKTRGLQMGYNINRTTYIVPLMSYKYNPITSSILRVSPEPSRTSQMNFIVDSSEPTSSYRDGTTWYNPETSEFKTYVSGRGFVKNTTELGFLQYNSKYTVTADVPLGDIVIPIGIDNFSPSDALRVLLNGIELLETADYTIDYSSKSISLQDMVLSEGDDLVFISTRIVDATNVTNITTQFLDHLQTNSSEDVLGHVRLTDDVEQSLGSLHTAVTPEGVHKMKYIKDDTTGTQYHFGIDNGILYVESED